MNKGFYSIVQYCPDLDRLETANLGLVLAVPSLGYLGTRFCPTNEAVKKRFGAQAFDPLRLEAVKAGFEEKLKREGQNWQSAEDLAAIAKKEGNHILLSPARTVLVNNPTDILEKLFLRVIHLAPARRQRLARPNLKELLEPNLIGVPLLRDYKLDLPEVGPQTFPYAFQNGQLNLLQAEAFPNDPKTLEQQAGFLASQGHLIHQFSKTTPAKLVVVAAFPKNQDEELKRKVRFRFQAHESRLVLLDEMPDFISEIRSTAH